MMPARLQSEPYDCSFHTIYAAFYLLEFCQEETTGVQDFQIVSFQTEYMNKLGNFKIRLQSIRGTCSSLYSLIYFFRKIQSIFLHIIKQYKTIRCLSKITIAAFLLHNRAPFRLLIASACAFLIKNLQA